MASDSCVRCIPAFVSVSIKNSEAFLERGNKIKTSNESRKNFFSVKIEFMSSLRFFMIRRYFGDYIFFCMI